MAGSDAARPASTGPRKSYPAVQPAVAGHEAFAGLPEAKLRAQVMPFAKYKREEAALIPSAQVPLSWHL